MQAVCNVFFMTLRNTRCVWRRLLRPPADWILISVSDCGVDHFAALLDFLFLVKFDRKLDDVYEDLATGEFCFCVQPVKMDQLLRLSRIFWLDRTETNLSIWLSRTFGVMESSCRWAILPLFVWYFVKVFIVCFSSYCCTRPGRWYEKTGEGL